MVKKLERAFWPNQCEIESHHESKFSAEIDNKSHYASSVIRGFGVYVLVLSGLLALATTALTSPDQGQYVRLAGLISVVSFYAGYDPRMLAGLLQRIENLMTP